MTSLRRRFRFWWNGTPTGRAVEVIAASLFVSAAVATLAGFVISLVV